MNKCAETLPGIEDEEKPGFRGVCERVSERYNIDLKDVVKTMIAAYSVIMDVRKRHGKDHRIEEITCDLHFRRLENAKEEDILLVFGPRQLVVIDVVRFRRVDPLSGEKTDTALLRICPGSFGRFADKYPGKDKAPEEETKSDPGESAEISEAVSAAINEAAPE